MQQKRERLLKLLLERAVTFGDFTLASGLKSSYYIDAKQILWHPESLHLVGLLMIENLARARVTAIGGLEIGAIPITSAMLMTMRYFGYSEVEGFVVRNDRKEHGRRSRRHRG